MSPTIRLYESAPAQYSFEGQVLSCEPAGDAWHVILDQTAFYPEGGGQPADQGSLGGAAVSDVHERQGVIVHTVSRMLPVGQTVRGSVDAARRLDHSQQHTGEHIFSGLLCSTHHAANVGFHIGERAVTVDFNVPLTLAQLAELERRANEAVWRDLPVICRYPSPEELARISYRSKKELTGPVRIVSIEGVDTCACCGTHVPTTGCVGQILVTDMIHYKGGVRLTLACGSRALACARERLAEGAEVSHLLSVPQGELAGALRRLMIERDSLKAERDQLAQRLFAQAAAQVADLPVRIVRADMLSPGSLRKAAGQLAEGALLAAVLLPEESGWQFALSSARMDVRPVCRALCDRFQGKGGGATDMAQGRLQACPEEAVRQALEAAAAD